ncbi:Uncharacterised protein [Shigella flexneri]|nr:Uncharacterised protein [Shigella flexneri]
MRVAPQCGETGGCQGRRNQPKNTDRCEANDQFHHKGNGIRHIIDQVFGGLVTVTQCEAEADRPHQNPDVVTFQQGVDGVGNHAHYQSAHHFDNA